jgi:hypothetical protein
MDQQPSSFFSSPRNLLRVFALVLLVVGTYGSMSAQVAIDKSKVATAVKTYDVAMTFTTPTTQSSPRVKVRSAEPFKVVVDDKGSTLMASLVLTVDGADSVKLAGTVKCGTSEAYPALVTRLGEAATVSLRDAGEPGCEVSMLVAEADNGAAT